MMDVASYIEAPWQRTARWGGSAGMIAAVHAAVAAFVFLLWPVEDREPETPPGAIMIELAALAAESPSDQQELSEQPQVQQAAPPPSPVDAEDPPEERAAEMPPSPQPEEAPPETPAPQPEAAAEPVRDTAAETPPVEEAPRAPEPEVTLPKQEAVKETAEPPREAAKEKTPDKPVRENSAKSPTAKAAKESDSRQQQQAAASAKGRFDPNPIYRAKPAYPAGARSQKIEGHVVVAYSVSPSGAVTSARVVSASPPGIFNSASLAAVRQWRFKPSPQGGSRSTTIRFKLR